MNEAQARYERVLAELNAAEPDPAPEGGEDSPRVFGGLNPYSEAPSSADLLREYQSRAGFPFRGELVRPGDS